MTSIDIFYQGEGIREIAHFEADPEHSFAAIKIAIIEKHGLDKETLIFLEDERRADRRELPDPRPRRPRRHQGPSAPLPPCRGGGHLQRRDESTTASAPARRWRGSRPGRPSTSSA